MSASAHQIQIHITRILRASFHKDTIFAFKMFPRPFRIIAEQEKTGAGYQPLHPRKSFFIISFRADPRIKAAMAFIQVIAPPDMDTDRLTVLYLFLQPEIILRPTLSRGTGMLHGLCPHSPGSICHSGSTLPAMPDPFLSPAGQS